MRNILLGLVLLLSNIFALGAVEQQKKRPFVEKEEAFNGSGNKIDEEYESSSKTKASLKILSKSCHNPQWKTPGLITASLIDFDNGKLFEECLRFFINLDDTKAYDYKSSYLLPPEFYKIRLIAKSFYSISEGVVSRYLLLPNEDVSFSVDFSSESQNASKLKKFKLRPDRRVRSFTPQDFLGRKLLAKKYGTGSSITFSVEFQGFFRRGDSFSPDTLTDSKKTAWPVQHVTFFSARIYDPLIIFVGYFLKHINMLGVFQSTLDKEKTLYDQIKNDMTTLIENATRLESYMDFVLTSEFENKLGNVISGQKILKNEKFLSSFWTLGLNEIEEEESPWINASLGCEKDEIFIVVQDHRKETKHPYPENTYCSFLMGYYTGENARGLPSPEEYLMIGKPLKPRWLFKVKIASSMDSIREYLTELTKDEHCDKKIILNEMESGSWGEYSKIDSKKKDL